MNCNMNFTNYPMDVQLCYMRVGSAGYDITQEVFNATLMQVGVIKSLPFKVETQDLREEEKV